MSHDIYTLKPVTWRPSGLNPWSLFSFHFISLHFISLHFIDFLYCFIPFMSFLYCFIPFIYFCISFHFIHFCISFHAFIFLHFIPFIIPSNISIHSCPFSASKTHHGPSQDHQVTSLDIVASYQITTLSTFG